MTGSLAIFGSYLPVNEAQNYKMLISRVPGDAPRNAPQSGDGCRPACVYFDCKACHRRSRDWPRNAPVRPIPEKPLRERQAEGASGEVVNAQVCKLWSGARDVGASLGGETLCSSYGGGFGRG